MNKGFNKFMKNNSCLIHTIFYTPKFQKQQSIFRKLNKQITYNGNISALSFSQVRDFTSTLVNKISSPSSSSLSSSSSVESFESKRIYNKNITKFSLEFKHEEWDQERKDKYFKSAKKSDIIIGLIAVNVLTWLYINSDDSYSFERMIGKNFMLSLDNFKNQPITLLTSMFAHIDGYHLLFNMLALYSLGPHVMHTIGSSAFFGLYMGAGILSGIGFLAIQKFYNKGRNYYDQKRLQNTRALGASGATSGVLMVFAWLYPKMSLSLYGLVPIPAALLVSAYFAYDLYNEVYRKQTGICHVGHLCGGVYGFLYYLSIRNRFRN
ncbi:hypothetical protein RB653_000936 [Dictyostelium firmibasis]|uniref:Peptidase S54 rhomboid domain-containing protein n=1 Tax=Dictyostelium firmibasis TaxID=79012 RepID=A0AAN7YYB0_9MYCE